MIFSAFRIETRMFAIVAVTIVHYAELVRMQVAIATEFEGGSFLVVARAVAAAMFVAAANQACAAHPRFSRVAV
ncbi:MAG: hypothetical protein GX483_06000 [Actinomycetaceae bacterium]|nr:hypothetical protein [Actinomycetaceae bacterium]